jgi:hypothetical protein
VAVLDPHSPEHATRDGGRRSPNLAWVEKINAGLERLYHGKFITENALDRRLVSFQANKSRAVYRWYKFKEAFSAGLVEFLLQRYGIDKGALLDPFAGSGTALFASSALGLSAEGIELLPIGRKIISTKRLIDNELTQEDIRTLSQWAKSSPWHPAKEAKVIPELRITKGAYPPRTLEAMGKFLALAENENCRVAAVLSFALLCILEAISYTRKDGQYLRWDYRSGRRQGKKVFDKGHIPTFDQAMTSKLTEIVADLRASDWPSELFSMEAKHGSVALHEGSCLE